MNRVAVVTGGASGIGLAIGRRLAAAGNAVALLDIDADTVVKRAAELTKKGARVRAYEADVADRKALERVFEAVRKDLGPITILVTSASVESFDMLPDITPEKWDRLLAVNLPRPSYLPARTLVWASAITGAGAHGPGFATCPPPGTSQVATAGLGVGFGSVGCAGFAAPFCAPVAV